MTPHSAITFLCGAIINFSRTQGLYQTDRMANDNNWTSEVCDEKLKLLLSGERSSTEKAKILIDLLENGYLCVGAELDPDSKKDDDNIEYPVGQSLAAQVPGALKSQDDIRLSQTQIQMVTQDTFGFGDPEFVANKNLNRQHSQTSGFGNYQRYADDFDNLTDDGGSYYGRGGAVRTFLALAFEPKGTRKCWSSPLSRICSQTERRLQ
ncbi:hypothetical protein B0T26DRAFT_679922 [Lasiosphaeria miniovina]|uniref:Uncharacterized protein n=1 Tax=Lasiosphaeria miniovina TaxID=1954250 RepID=A0AA39ZYY9_9PEZI|nr:uncharacterized protein B0T26DRAFT_679922 [Lasiosphaeria miniovina]KAK0706210.1 hypothetical protein B0T26DRAFT_679922 [Lasiosphaeria miniovina]